MGLTSRIPGGRRGVRAIPAGDAEAPHPQLERRIVWLDDGAATDPRLAGRKAANLAKARALGFPVLPGFVVTTSASSDLDGPLAGAVPPLLAEALRRAWSDLSADGERTLVVRSSSPGEDGGASSMAGQFTSVLGVRSWADFLSAVDAVLDSASTVVLDGVAGAVVAPMAVLVQPEVSPVWGGVLFGVDPVTGRTGRLVIAAVEGGPDRLVSGTVDGARYTVSRRGHLLATDGDRLARRLPARQRRGLARLAARAERAFGGHQDIEWAYVEGEGLLLLQSRPVTAVGVAADAGGPVLGPGPVAETFPEPLAPLEEALWLPPLRQALVQAVRLTGAASRRRLRTSPVIASVAGRVAADLDLLGVAPLRRSMWSRLDPRPPARRLVAAWRTGRLRVALPALGRHTVRRVDEELAGVPSPKALSDDQLIALLRGSRQVLLAVHGYEVLAGMLSTGKGGAPTSAAAALLAVAEARAGGADDADIVARHPVALALVPPMIGVHVPLPPVTGPPPPTGPGEPDELAVLREELRLRARWVQEVTAQVADELGSRLERRDLLPLGGAVRWLDVDELEAAVTGGRIPDDLDERADVPTAALLPAAFRLTPGGDVVPVDQGGGRDGQGAGGGRAQGRVHEGDGAVEAGEVLVVRTLDPGLAAVLPQLGGLVSETGSVLSHLAILARELGVPTVVGVADALSRFAEGSEVVVDGTTGEVSLVEQPAVTTSGGDDMRTT